MCRCLAMQVGSLVVVFRASPWAGPSVSARGRLRRTAHRDGLQLALVRPAVEIRPTSPQHPSTVLIAETHPQLSEMIEPAPDRTKPTRLDQSDEYEWVSIGGDGGI